MSFKILIMWALYSISAFGYSFSALGNRYLVLLSTLYAVCNLMMLTVLYIKRTRTARFLNGMNPQKAKVL